MSYNKTLLLTIKIEETRLKTEQAKLQTEKTKLEQLRLSNQITTTNISGDQNNTFNISINNINNLVNPKLTVEEAKRLYTDDMQKLIQNVFKHQYASDVSNKCVKHLNKNQFLVKMDDKAKQLKFDELRSTILTNYKNALDDVLGIYYPTEFNSRRYSCLSETQADKYEDSVKYTHNTRNNGILKKSLQSAVS